MSELDQEAIRRAKLQQLREAGQDPFLIQRCARTHSNAQLHAADEAALELKVTLASPPSRTSTSATSWPCTARSFAPMPAS